MLAGVSSTNRITCLSASLLIVMVTMNVQAFDFAQSQKRRFKVEVAYGYAQSVQSNFVQGAGHCIAESGERFRGVAVTRLEQFPKACGCGCSSASVEVWIRFASRPMEDDVR